MKKATAEYMEHHPQGPQYRIRLSHPIMGEQDFHVEGLFFLGQSIEESAYRLRAMADLLLMKAKKPNNNNIQDKTPNLTKQH